MRRSCVRFQKASTAIAASAGDSALREDVVVRSDVITEVLRGAPDSDMLYFRVPRVIEK
jgi:Asp-tRNA(Asn)/Glu-tRNA(Gln) amidotransferase C subunit